MFFVHYWIENYLMLALCPLMKFYVLISVTFLNCHDFTRIWAVAWNGEWV